MDSQLRGYASAKVVGRSVVIEGREIPVGSVLRGGSRDRTPSWGKLHSECGHFPVSIVSARAIWQDPGMQLGTSRKWGLAAACGGLLAFAPGFVPPVSAGDLQALGTQFEEALAAGEDADARAAGKRILAKFPDDAASLSVLRAFHERDWKWPRLRTSFAVLLRWERDVLDGKREPELRLRLIGLLERMYPGEETVKNGGTLYEKAYTALQAGRARDAIRFSKMYLTQFDRSSTADKIRVIVLAEALLAKDPPDLASARRVLQEVVDKPKSRYHDRAVRRLDQLVAGGRWIKLGKGCPRAKGLGRTVLLTDLRAGDDLIRAVEPWRTARKAKVLRFRTGKPLSVAEELRKLGPEFVAILVRPRDLDTNLHSQVLKLCRDLDGDPLPDFHFGYLVARDAKDLRALAERSVAASPRQDPRLSRVSLPKNAGDVAGFDGFLHYGHGTPYDVVGGIHARDLSAGSLSRAPLVVSGACYNGVVGRSWHPWTRQPTFGASVEVKPEEALSLAWIRAGAIGVVASMEADRGEMAGAEWAWLLETACPLGELPGLSYRLAFTSLPESFKSLPIQKTGKKRSLELYDVMLRGQLGRALIGDPSVRILDEPSGPATTEASAWRDEEGRFIIEVEPTESALRGEAQFLSTNTLTRTGMSGKGFTERRLWARVELPDGLKGRLLAPEVRVEAGGREIEVKRSCVRHEVWGGRRFVCVQIESADGVLSRPGAKATFTFPTTR